MLYCLSHTGFEMRGREPYALDYKLIGHYAGLDEALAAQARCAEKPGFSAYPEGFRIDLVLPCDGAQAAEPCRARVVYRISYASVRRDHSLECFVGGYYLSMEAANSALDRLKGNRLFAESAGNLEICEIVVGRSAWVDGFDSYEW